MMLDTTRFVMNKIAMMPIIRNNPPKINMAVIHTIPLSSFLKSVLLNINIKINK